MSITGGDRHSPGISSITTSTVFLISGHLWTWSNMPAAVTEILGDTFKRFRIDLSGFSMYFLNAKMRVSGFSAAIVKLQYSNDNGLSWSDLSDSGGSVLINTTTPSSISGAIVTPARRDTLIRCVGSGGNGVIDPAFSEISIIFHGGPGDANITLAEGHLYGAIPLALSEIQSTMRLSVDLGEFSQFRLVLDVGIAGAAGTMFGLRYSSDEITWNDLSSVPASGDVPVSSIGAVAGAWSSIAAGAKTTVFVSIFSHGGNGVANASVYMFNLQLRR